MKVNAAHRQRSYFVSREGGLAPVSADEFLRAAKISKEQRKATNGPPMLAQLVIADCRMLDQEHVAHHLLPESFRRRMNGSVAEAEPERRVEWTLRRLAPWIGAAISALAGFLIFLGKAG